MKKLIRFAMTEDQKDIKNMEAQIRELYTSQELPIRKVADIMGVSSSTLRRSMKAFGILSRDKNHGRISWWQSHDYLYKAYVVQKLSTISIAGHVQSTPGTVCSWLTKFNIKRRDKGGSLKGQTMSLESRELMSKAKKGKYLGDKNPNWKGSLVKPEVRERNSYIAKKWRQIILARDNNVCQQCKSNERLHVHHIKAFKDYPDQRWDINNGVTLCVSCHENVHHRKFPAWVSGRDEGVHGNIEVVEIRPKVCFEIDKDKLQKLYTEHSMAKIGKMFGVSSSLVGKQLHTYGIATRASGGRRRFDIDKETLDDLYQQHSMKKIAEILGVGETVIHKRIHEYSIVKK